MLLRTLVMAASVLFITGGNLFSSTPSSSSPPQEETNLDFRGSGPEWRRGTASLDAVLMDKIERRTRGPADKLAIEGLTIDKKEEGVKEGKPVRASIIIEWDRGAPSFSASDLPLRGVERVRRGIRLACGGHSLKGALRMALLSSRNLRDSYNMARG